MNDLLYKLGHVFSGPILFDYVWWILLQAKNRKISTLYFLARDGYLLQKIAECFCQKFDIPIECRYLYCSRTSLRMPCYNFIGNEAYDLIFLGGYQVTANSLLQRINLDDEEKKEVLNECGWSTVDQHRLLNRIEQEELCRKLKNCRRFQYYMKKKSKLAYANTIGYLTQEGLLTQSEVAIVDSGWTGSMQRSLRQLLCSAGFQGHITGFYFGMYASPKEEDGTYLTWYFNHCGKWLYKVPFCNNLFECLLSAPHGMTIGYECNDHCYHPILLPSQTTLVKAFILEQINSILDYTNIRLNQISFEDMRVRKLQRDTSAHIWRYMAHPTQKEASMYGAFLFCDDVTEAYHLKLAGSEQVDILNSYCIPARILRKLFPQSPQTVFPELLWPYGTISFAPKWKRSWYRWNIYGWELGRSILK